MYGGAGFGKVVGKGFRCENCFGDQLIEAHEEASKDPGCKGRDFKVDIQVDSG